jgi:hypothetical protein
MRVESSVVPLPGASVAQTVERLGMPLFDIIPGFQAKFLSGGIIWADAGCDIRPVKIRTKLPKCLNGFKLKKERANIIAPGSDALIV